ncbi:MAG TPA: hypothetical protein VJ982_02050 [Gemmatimonadota bacterium]|nr:hypothetical protein [Gemmatimonadota bacterium]
MSPAAFDPLRMLEALRRHEVRYVLIGGFAGRLLGSPTVTNDLDVCYARDDRNLERLSDALRELGARLRGVDDDVPFLLDARTLRAGDAFTLVTDAGNLDVFAYPSGSGGYETLHRTAETLDIDGHPVSVAAVEDLIRMKLAAGRPKDRVEVEILSALQDEIERGIRPD